MQPALPEVDLKAIRRVFAAAAGANCVANAAWWMQPLLMHELAEVRGLEVFASGLILSFEMAAMALTSVLATRYLVGRSLLVLALSGLGLAIVGCFISLEASSAAILLVARIIAGAGAGLSLLMMNAVVAGMPDPDKAFARLSVVSILYGMTIVAAVPFTSSVLPGSSPFLVLLMALAVTVPFVALLPGGLNVSAHHDNVDGSDNGKGILRRILFLAAITFAIGCASGIMWAFYALIGQQAGLSIAAVDGAISASIFGALCSAGLASVVGHRFSRTVLIAAGLSVLALSVVILSSSPGAAAYRAAVIGNVGALYFLTPFLFGAAAAQDSSGRGAVYVGSAFYLTGAIGPALGGFLAATVGMHVVGIATIGIAFISLVGIWRLEQDAARSLAQGRTLAPVRK